LWSSGGRGMVAAVAKGAPRSVVLGTAGHIDHGKTTLVRALTGIDTDRLPEEKRRGITIELGFAPWTIAPDLEASIVDVPGHEGFVRTMVAGAGGIDAVMLVVSAEDGVMPQTREHVNVCRLLGVQHGVVALTKIDRLEGDEEAIELAVDDVREALRDTVFAESTIVPCSALTGAGLDTLRATVAALVHRLPRRDTKGDVLIPLDRVFSIKGHGTVVTGTLLRGVVDIGKDHAVRLEPHGEGREPTPVRARAAQVRGAERDRILAGSRIALNLAGVETSALSRGDVLTRGAIVARRDVFHAWMQHLPGETPAWSDGTSVQICVGTAHATGRLDPLRVLPREGEADDDDDRSIPPGREGLVRVRLDAPLPVWRDARVVARGFSDASVEVQGRTVGGGWIVDPQPSSGRSQRSRWIALGEALARPDPLERAAALVRDAGALGIDVDEVSHRTGTVEAKALLNRLGQGKRPEAVALPGDRFVHEDHVRPLVDAAVAIVDRFHAEHPLQGGLGRAAVEASLGGRVAPDVAALAVERAIERGALRDGGQGTLSRPGKGLQVGGELPAELQRVLELYEQAGTSPPTLKEIATSVSLDARVVLEIVGNLQRTGRLVKVTPDLSFSKSAHEQLIARVRQRLAEAGTIDVQALKSITGLSRKFVVPFLEHLDSLHITLRQGDRRIPGPRA
jgi:selenocysteine-specific elongation factor